MSAAMLPLLGIAAWTELSLSSLAERIAGERPRPLVLVDGAAGSGKTTLAGELAAALGANFVHTDDISWCADPIRWDGELLSGIVTPWRRGEDVSFRPSGWMAKGRPGAIDVDPGRALVIEGMGACRKTLRALADHAIWVDTPPETARARVVRRDLERGENGGTVESVTRFADWWDSLLTPLFLEEEPWKYADLIVNGAGPDPDAGRLLVYTPGA